MSNEITLSGLMEDIRTILATEGRKGKLRLALEAERSERQIENYAAETTVPRREVAYRLAMATGKYTPEQCLELANQLHEPTKESA